MDINLGIGYDKKSKTLGYIKDIDITSKTVVLFNSDEECVVDFDDLIQMKEIAEMNGYSVYESDVIMVSDEKLYELSINQDNKIMLYLLNSSFDRVGKGHVVNTNFFHAISTISEVVGNIYEMKNELENENELKKYTFNIELVRDKDLSSNGKLIYYYACNNKLTEEIDLIKVVFVGHHLLEEENYTRATLSYEVYYDSIESGTLIQAEPRELMNLVTGAISDDYDYGEEEYDEINLDEEFDFENYQEDEFDEFSDDDEFYCLHCGENRLTCDECDEDEDEDEDESTYYCNESRCADCKNNRVENEPTTANETETETETESEW